MPPKKFKPQVHEDDGPPKLKPKNKSLSTSQYDDIFNAVINKQSSRHIHDFKSPIIGKSPEVDAFSPKECASLENSQSSQNQKEEGTKKQEKMKRIYIPRNTELVVSLNKPKQVHSESSNNQSESVSTVHSEEFRKNAAFSTPIIKETTTLTSTKKKQKSFREAVQTLKESESQLSETLLGGLSQAQTSLNNSLLVDVPLSQPPEHLNHRERLLWLQARRGEKVFVQCDDCDKWRLSDVQDPVDLPDKWYCHMNKDRNFNNCSIPEQKLSIYVEADLIINQYTAGSLVWAKIFSYPWWPAMVDDDPDTEQFYWIEDYDLNVPKFYNVTFFDRQSEPVTRAWITASNLKSFKHNLDVDKRNVAVKYRARIRCAKEQALEASNLPIKERLIQYSFISKTRHRINTPVGTPVHCGDSDDEIEISRDSKKINKRRCTIDDPAAQLRKRLLQECQNEKQINKKAGKKENKTLQPSEVTKKVTKRRKTIGDANELLKDMKGSKKDKKNVDLNLAIKNKTRVSKLDNFTKETNNEKANIRDIASEKKMNEENTLNEKKDKKLQKIRNSAPERDSSQDSSVSGIVTRRRSTRADTSIESDCNLSKDLTKGKKITKRRSTTSVSTKANIEQEKDVAEPKKITRRRNTRGNMSIERDSNLSQDSNKETKITKHRDTFGVGAQKPVIDDSIELKKDETVKRTLRRRTSIVERNFERNSSQDLKKPKNNTERRSTRGNTSIERDSSSSLDSSKITKRVKNESQSSAESQKTVIELKAKSTPRRRKSILERSSERDTSQDLHEPNRMSRRVTRGDTSNERDSSFSQDSNKVKKITKRRSTTGVIEAQVSQKTVNEKDTDKLEKDEKGPSRQNANPQKDSSQDMNESKRITRRRNTRGNTSIERDSSLSQNSSRERKITKRRSTIAENMKESPISDKFQDDNQEKHHISILGRDSSQSSNLSEDERSKNNRIDTSLERESSISERSDRCSRIMRRRMTIGKYDSQNSEDSQVLIKEKSTSRKSSIIERDSSQNSNASAKIFKRKNTLDDTQQKAQESLKLEPISQNENKENTIKRRRNTIRESSSQRNSSQNSNDSQKITKRRSTIADTSLEGEMENKAIKERNMQQIVNNSQNENKRRIREKASERDSSQNSDEFRANTKRKNTNIEKENTSTQVSQREKKVTKRRQTIAEFNHQTINTEESQNTNIQNSEKMKINRRRDTIEKDTNLTNLSIRSDGSSKQNKQRSSFVCPVVTNFTEESRITESQSEPKKSRRTLGARKMFATSKPTTSVKGTESGYESAISTKRDETNKQNLSMILEESYNSPKLSDEKLVKYHIPKKRRQTTDGQEKTIDEKKKVKGINDDELPRNTFTSLSHSLEQLDAEKRKKKFMAICKEIVNIDKDPADPTISEEEKLFYEKLNSSLERVKEKQGNSSEDKLMKKVKDFEDKLDKAMSSATSANTSMHSDFYDVDYRRAKMLSNKSSSDDLQLNKKRALNSSSDSEDDSLPFEM